MPPVTPAKDSTVSRRDTSRLNPHGGRTDNASLGALLRQWRTEADLSLSQVALRAGIAKSSISVWENDRHQPRIPELTALLTALGVKPQEIGIALTHIRAPRALAEQTALIQTVLQSAELAPTPGRLLRAIRERRGLSLRRLAQSAGRTPTELVRWETKGVRPSAAALAALLTHLNADETETRWLQERFARIAPPESCEGATLDSLEASLITLRGQVDHGHHDALDLDFLLWEMQVCGWLMVEREAATELLRNGRSNYAMWLMWDGRLAEGNSYAASSIRLAELGSRQSPSASVTTAAHVRGCYEARFPPRKRPDAAVRLLHDLLGASADPGYQSTILRDIAQFAIEAKEIGYALKASERALQLAYATDDADYIRPAAQERIEVATRAGLWSEAFSLLSGETTLMDAAFMRIQQSFRWVDLLTEMGDGPGADAYLRRVYADMEQYEYLAPSLFQRAEDAAQSIERLSRRAL